MAGNDFVEPGFVEDFFVESGPHTGLRRVVVVVMPERRVADIPAERRVARVSHEDRIALVSHEGRIAFVSPENRVARVIRGKQ